MNILREYIRYKVNKLLEQAPASPAGASKINPYPASNNPPRLPGIRASTGGGGVPKEGGNVNADRVKFAEAATNLFQSYLSTTNTNRRFDPKTARYLNNVANQVMEQLMHDTNNWTDVEEDLEQRLSELVPETSALQKLIDYTEWYNSTPPDPSTLQQYFTEINSDIIPKINDALQAYIENYS